jgi:hypothetical protein
LRKRDFKGPLELKCQICRQPSKEVLPIRDHPQSCGISMPPRRGLGRALRMAAEHAG